MLLGALKEFFYFLMFPWASCRTYLSETIDDSFEQDDASSHSLGRGLFGAILKKSSQNHQLLHLIAYHSVSIFVGWLGPRAQMLYAGCGAIPAHRKQKQEECQFKANQVYSVRPSNSDWSMNFRVQHWNLDFCFFCSCNGLFSVMVSSGG